jgi:PAS domain S-box-containing protein
MDNSNNQLTPQPQPALILLVDDDGAMRRYLSILLEKDGYTVAEAEDGLQALTVYQKLQPDLVLMDAVMPLMDGFTACTHLRALPDGERTPILMLTSLTDDEAVDLAFESGATDFIIKPIHKGVLRQRVRHLLRAKRAEDALRYREQLYRAIVEDQTELVCRFLPDGTLTFVNEAYCRYFANQREELLGHSFMITVPEASREIARKQLASLSWKKPVGIFENTVILSNGEIRWQQWTNRLIFDEQGYLFEIQSVGRDITDLKHTTAALHQKTAELQAVFEAIPDLLFVFDADGIYVDFYAGSLTDLYLPPEKLLGKAMQEVLPAEPALLMHETVVKVLQTGEPYTLEYTLPFAHGEQTYEGRFRPFLEGRVICITRNITERKQMESRMLNSQKLADLGTLAAGVAHEINSPLQVITGLSESLLDRLQQSRLEPDYLKRKLETIQRNSWRCVEIVRSLRNYAHVATSQAGYYDLNAIVQDTLLLIEHQLKSWSNITVISDLSLDLPPLWCDRNQITQVLINLLTNARDAMPETGEITLHTSYNRPTDQLVLQVTDTGYGIPPAIVAKIFDPFFTTKPIGQGTGLGLSIVAGIIRASGGEIKVDSIPNQGTTFTLLFPREAVLAVSMPISNTLARFSDAVCPEFNLNEYPLLS